jgi:2-dehydropantoate 2-reductase
VRILVMGAGAVGGYFGARLAAAGSSPDRSGTPAHPVDVRFVARGEHLAALQRHGLVVHTPTGDLSLSTVQAYGSPAEAGPADLILVAVKSYDTAAAAEALKPATRPDTIVLSLQNGVENEEILERTLELPPLLRGLTQIGSELMSPGRIRYFARGTIIFGEPDGARTTRTTTVADVFSQAGISVHVSRDIRVRQWDKLGWNAGFNAVTTLTRQTVAQAIDEPDTRRLIADAMAEVAAVAGAQGIRCDASRIQTVIEDSRTGLGDFKTSMLQDHERGRRLEDDAINGAVVRAADRAGVPAPINRTLWTLLGHLPGRVPV